MSLLLSPIMIGDMEIKNRFVISAICEGMALETGEVTEWLIQRYRTRARGKVGSSSPVSFLCNHKAGG